MGSVSVGRREKETAGGEKTPLPPRYSAAGRLLKRGPGQRREGDDLPDALRRDVARAVPQPLLRAPQPAPRHVDFEEDDVLDASPVAPDGVPSRPPGAGRRV